MCIYVGFKVSRRADVKEKAAPENEGDILGYRYICVKDNIKNEQYMNEDAGRVGLEGGGAE